MPKRNPTPGRPLVQSLLTPGFYLLPKIKHSGRIGYTLYKGNREPVTWYSEKQIKPIKNFFKKNSSGQITFNLSLIRRESGKTLVKKLYRKAVDIKRKGV